MASYFNMQISICYIFESNTLILKKITVAIVPYGHMLGNILLPK